MTGRRKKTRGGSARELKPLCGGSPHDFCRMRVRLANCVRFPGKSGLPPVSDDTTGPLPLPFRNGSPVNHGRGNAHWPHRLLDAVPAAALVAPAGRYQCVSPDRGNFPTSKTTSGETKATYRLLKATRMSGAKASARPFSCRQPL